MNGALLRLRRNLWMAFVVAVFFALHSHPTSAQEPRESSESQDSQVDSLTLSNAVEADAPATPSAATTPDSVASEDPETHSDADAIDADSPDVFDSPDALEQVVVAGEQPGPGLWKVTHGENTLWIVSTFAPLPKGLKWRSRQLESIVASADLVFANFEVKPNIGIFRGLRYLPALLRARFNHDKAVLKDLITPEQYATWLPLRKEYFKDDDDIEKLRPMFIAFALASKATANAGFRDAAPVGAIVRAAAKKHRVKWKTTEIRIDIKSPKELIKAFNETTPRENDVGCFLAALENLDAEIEGMKERASAWAVGDVEAFRKVPRPRVERQCIEAATSAPAVHELFGSVLERFTETWLAEAESALATHKTSIALIDLDNLIREDGVVSQLRARGYTVEEPQ